MPTFQSFEDIGAWQKARMLVRKIRVICKREVVRKDFAFEDTKEIGRMLAGLIHYLQSLDPKKKRTLKIPAPITKN